MQASELDKAVAYTKQFIEAATPIAKKAYDIGLVTLRVDAVQSLVSALVTLAIAIWVCRKISRDWTEAKRVAASPAERGTRYSADCPSSHLMGDGIPYIFGGMAATLALFFSLLVLLDIWVWVKLFSPDLWLAHRAIEKLIA